MATYSALPAGLVVDAVEDGGQVCVRLPILPTVATGRWGLDALVDEFQARRHLPRSSQGLDGQLLGPVVPHALHTCAGQSGAVRLLADSPIQVDLQDRQATFMSELDLGLGDTHAMFQSEVESDLNDGYSVKSGGIRSE